MLDSSARADIAVGYFFKSGFGQITNEPGKLQKVRILVGRTDQQVLEEVGAGMQQARALSARKSERSRIARQAVEHIAEGVSQLPQAEDSQDAVARLRDLIGEGTVEVRTYVRGPLTAKAYLCWYEKGHAEPGTGDLSARRGARGPENDRCARWLLLR